MDYAVTFLEGIITFISPCLLPMLPIYLAYFAGAANEQHMSGAQPRSATGRTMLNALGFVIGFTAVFVALGALGGALGSIISTHQTVFNVACGALVIVFGLHFAGLRIPLLDRTLKPGQAPTPTGFAFAVLFGVFFSIGWTPCVGAFLSSALLLAASEGSAAHGICLLLAYSAGLGVPFLLSALIIDQLSGLLDAIKRNYAIINKVCGALLVVVGVLMATGMFNTWLSLLSA